MNIPATQICEDNDFISTQKLSHLLQHEANEEQIQVGVLITQTNIYPIKRGIRKIGRDPECSIILNHQTVSKQHAEIEANSNESSAWLCDLNSSNKTKLNNTILRPGRCYELKDGSIIDFGMVRAVYKSCRSFNVSLTESSNLSLIPETPALNRQQKNQAVIPGTPDSSLNNSSTLGENVSMIPATQAGDEESVFRRPSLPQRTSASSKKSFVQDSSMEDSMNDSRSSTSSKKDNVGESRVSIHDMETQKSFESQNETDVDIHDVETQKICLSSIKTVKNALPNQQNIHDVETQHDENIEMQARLTDIHDLETQQDEDMNVETRPINIHDLETQQDKDIKVQAPPTNIHDLETQHDEDIYNMKTPRRAGVQNVSMEDQHDTIRDNEMSKIEKTELTTVNEDISSMETQKIEAKKSTLPSTDVSHKNEDAEISRKATPGEVTINTEEAGNAHKSSQEYLQLSLATNFEDECSELDRSRNLLGSQNLLEDFVEDDELADETKSGSPVKPSRSCNDETTERSTDEENIFDAATQVKNADENMYEAVTQRINLPLKASLMNDDSDDTDQEGVFQRYSRISSQDSTQPSKSQLDDSDSDTDEEGRFVEIALQEKRASCSFETRKNESKEAKNDGGVSRESDDLFDMPTQRINLNNKKSPAKVVKVDRISVDFDAPTQVINTKKSETSATVVEKAELDGVDDLAPTQILPTEEPCAKVNESSVCLTTEKPTIDEKEDITEMEDDIATQILSFSEKVSDTNDKESSKSHLLEEASVEDIDYEMAPTQLITETEKKKPKKANLDDTLERNLNEMFDDVNEEQLEEQPQISTQVLTNMLQTSQCDDKVIDKPNEGSVSPSIGAVRKFTRGRRSKIQMDLVAELTPSKKTRKPNLKTTTADTDSQNSETYFSTLTSTRKRNILVDSQDSVAPVENMSESKKTEKLPTDTINDTHNTTSDASLKFTPKSSSTPRLSRRHKIEELSVHEPIVNKIYLSESNKDTLKESAEKVAEVKPRTPNRISTILEDDVEEDIMAGLPEVRISGTLSNPASPTSSTSTEFRLKNKKKQDPKEDVPKRKPGRPKKLQKSVTSKTTENAEPDHVVSKPNSSTVLNNFRNISVDVVSLQLYKIDEEVSTTFKQLTKKIFSKNSQKTIENQSRKPQNSVPPADAQEQITCSPSIQSKGRTRNSRKENVDFSSVFQVGKEAPFVKTEPAKRATLNVSRAGKRSLSTTDVSDSISVKKRKEDINEDAPEPTKGKKRNTKNATVNRSNSINILDYMVKRNSPAITETDDTNSSLSQSSLCSKQLMIKVARMSPCTPTESLSSTSISSVTENTINNEAKKTRRTSVNSQNTLKTLAKAENEKVVQNVGIRKNTSQRVSRRKGQVEDISSQVGEESQEVEMIMNQQMPKVQMSSLKIEKKKNTNESKKVAKTRNTRTRANASALTDTESSSISSDVCESDNAHFEMPTSKAKRAKSSKSNLSTADTTVNEATSTRGKRNSKQAVSQSRSTRSQQSTTDSSMEESKEVSTTRTSTNNASQASTTKKGGRKPKAVKGAAKKQSEDFIEETTSSEINSSFDSVSVPSTPRTRRTMSSSFSASSPFKVRHKILFTGITSNEYNKLLTRLGATQVEDPTKCSMLVTDKVRRTFKFLCALAQSIPIVSIDWLAESEKAGHFVEWENYILKDPAAEAKFGFKLRRSLEKAKEQKLLEGYTIVLTPNVAPPPLPEFKSIISSCGGAPLIRPPTSWPQKAVIISREEDLANAKKFLAKAPKTVTIQSTEFLLTGILRQELDFVKYKLT
ncbi:mutator 2 [Calliopsis andreniformis]|uniref:mutator 2 n=1 Tax=Calliopsis andreniformis TaxID=337506 RepID=UPI003FCC5736